MLKFATSPCWGPDGRPQVFWGGKPRSRWLWLKHRRQHLAPERSRAHFLYRRGCHEVAVYPDLPSAAECPIDGSQAQVDVARGRRQIGLCSEQILLCGKHGREIPGARIVLVHCKAQSTPCGLRALPQESDL